MNPRIIRACLVGFCISTSALHVSAQCGDGYLGLTLLLPRAEVTTAFSGTVVDVQHVGAAQVVTFTVDHVWKGVVASRWVIYRPFPMGSGGLDVGTGAPLSFDSGRRYFVLAHRLSDAERTELGIVDTAPERHGTTMCGDGSRPFDVVEQNGELNQIGPGYEPF